MTEGALQSPDATEASESRLPGGPVWVRAGIAVVFGLFYAWDVWAAVGNLVGLNLTAQNLGTQLSGFGWSVLIGAMLVPILAFALAFWLGRRRSPAALAVLLLAGLAVSAALALDVYVGFGLGALIV